MTGFCSGASDKSRSLDNGSDDGNDGETVANAAGSRAASADGRRCGGSLTGRLSMRMPSVWTDTDTVATFEAKKV